MKNRLWRVLVVVVALATAAVGGTGSLAAATSAPAAHSGRNLPPGAVVVSATPTSFGRVLVAGDGHALYSFSGDAFPFSPTGPVQLPCTALNRSATGTPCTVHGPPPAPRHRDLWCRRTAWTRPGLGRSRNGVDQVTYFGQPLYEFVGDTAAGQVNGANVAAFDGIFWLMSADGRPAPGVATVETEVSPNGNPVLSTPTAHGTERSLYELTYDEPDQTTCLSTTGCTAVWPPLLTDGAPVAGAASSVRCWVSRVGLTEACTSPTTATPSTCSRSIWGPGTGRAHQIGEYFADAMADGVWYAVSP